MVVAATAAAVPTTTTVIIPDLDQTMMMNNNYAYKRLLFIVGFQVNFNTCSIITFIIYILQIKIAVAIQYNLIFRVFIIRR